METTWLTMADGLEVRLQFPDLSSVDIYAVAHQLAQINRFNGAAKRPYSVAEHSLLVLDIMERFFGITSPAVLLLGLMHDAHEALTGDMATPIKQTVGNGWAGFEEHMEHAVLKRFGLLTARNGYRVNVHHADRLALLVERTQLMPATQQHKEPSTPWPCLAGMEPLPFYDLMHPMRVSNTWEDWAQMFVERFVELDVQRRGIAA